MPFAQRRPKSVALQALFCFLTPIKGLLSNIYTNSVFIIVLYKVIKSIPELFRIRQKRQIFDDMKLGQNSDLLDAWWRILGYN